MDTKEIVWLTSVSAWLWLLPSMVLAAETPQAIEHSKDGANAEAVPEAQPGKLSEELSEQVSEKLSEKPSESLQVNQLHHESTRTDLSSIDVSEPGFATDSVTEPATDSKLNSIVSPNILPNVSEHESSEVTATASKLQSESSSAPPSHLADPLEQLSTEEWLDLLADPTDKPPAAGLASTQTTRGSTSTPLAAAAIAPTPTSSDQRTPQTLAPPPLTSISYRAADLMPAAPEALITDPEPALLDISAKDILANGRHAAINRAQNQSEGNSAPLHHWQTLNQNSLAVWGRGPTPASNSLLPPARPALISDGQEAANSMAQVTSVSQLADVQPTDWAYQALQSLVERYGVIEGYPDGLFRGERALTRYEFAAGVNAAMDRLTQLIANSTENSVSKADLATIKRLQDDFYDELITLRGRLDGLEARIAELSTSQFSTTVVLNGQVTFGLADAWGGDPPGLGETNPVFAYLAQLQLSGSFSERDAFRIDFDAGNFEGAGFAEPQALNTQMALMGFQTDTNNTLELSGAEYRFAVGERLVFTLKPVGFSLSTVLSPNSIYSSVSQGALSRFAAETPIFKIGSLDAGVGLDWLVTDRLRLQLAYGARDASDPIQGLFKSDHRAFGVQLLARPFGAFTTGIAYVNAFADDGFLDTFTGSNNADTSGGFLEPAAIHAISGTFQWPIVPNVVLGAWGGLAVTDSLSSDAVALSSTYQFSLGFPDTFGREGDLLGIMVGQPFRLRYGLLIEREDEGSGLHYEIFYRIRVNDNIAITPGVFVVTDPGHISDNDTIVVAALRTSFSF
jgi:hypothetical protein